MSHQMQPLFYLVSICQNTRPASSKLIINDTFDALQRFPASHISMNQSQVIRIQDCIVSLQLVYQITWPSPKYVMTASRGADNENTARCLRIRFLSNPSCKRNDTRPNAAGAYNTMQRHLGYHWMVSW